MSETVVGVDCVALVMDYLDPLITPSTHSRVPNPRPARFVRVSAAGGPGFEGKVLWRAAVTVESWAASESQAMTDCLEACAHLEASQTFYAECSAPVSLPDPDTNTPRYISTAQIAVVGSILAQE